MTNFDFVFVKAFLQVFENELGAGLVMSEAKIIKNNILTLILTFVLISLEYYLDNDIKF